MTPPRVQISRRFKIPGLRPRPLDLPLHLSLPGPVLEELPQVEPLREHHLQEAVGDGSGTPSALPALDDSAAVGSVLDDLLCDGWKIYRFGRSCDLCDVVLVRDLVLGDLINDLILGYIFINDLIFVDLAVTDLIVRQKQVAVGLPGDREEVISIYQ